MNTHTFRKPTYTQFGKFWRERRVAFGWMAPLALLSVMWNMIAYLPVRR